MKELIEDGQRIKLGVQIAGTYSLFLLLSSVCPPSSSLTHTRPPLAGDAQKLVRDFSFRPAGCLELNALVRSFDPSRLVNRPGGLIGLQELTGIYLERYLPKEASVRCGKWNLALGEEQIRCALSFLPFSFSRFESIERCRRY